MTGSASNMKNGRTYLFSRALFGDPYMPKSIVGYQLLVCRRLRALRACITPYCYAWLRLTDDLKHAQRKLLEYRP